MITPTQVLNEIILDSTGDPPVPQYTALTSVDQLLLEGLVKQYDGYYNFIGKWPDLSGTIELERGIGTEGDPNLGPTDKTYYLKAILTALNVLPPQRVESQGTDKSPSFFSTKDNWNELAQDTLNCLYELPVDVGPQRFVLVQRRICDLVLNENTLFLKSDKIY